MLSDDTIRDMRNNLMDYVNFNPKTAPKIAAAFDTIIRLHLAQVEPKRDTLEQPDCPRCGGRMAWDARCKSHLCLAVGCGGSVHLVARGDMARAVELLRRAAYVNGTSIPRFVKFDGRHWGDDARDFLASIGGKA